MENLRTGLLIGVVLAVLAAVWLGVAGFVALPWITGGAGSSPQGARLIYEVDPQSTDGKIDMDKVVAAVERRLNPGRSRTARVRALDNGRIEVALFSVNAAAAENVDRLLERAGTLEFRILADKNDPAGNAAPIVKRALADPSKTKVTDAQGRLFAWWVPVKAGQERGFAGPGYDGAARRTRTQGGREITELLVLNDIYNVTGAYITNARPAVDSQGRPCISFNFNTAGGHLFGPVTRRPPPDKRVGFTHKLGIIVDGELYSAPAIQSTIYDAGEMTGSFTQQEVEDLSRVLNAGTLPARIRLAAKRASP
jgi:SecD/SecF fusion protein